MYVYKPPSPRLLLCSVWQVSKIFLPLFRLSPARGIQIFSCVPAGQSANGPFRPPPAETCGLQRKTHSPSASQLTRPKGPQCPLPATVRVKFPAISGFDTCLVSISCPPFGLGRNFPSTPTIWLVLPVCVSPARPELEFPVRAGASRSRRQPCLLNLGGHIESSVLSRLASRKSVPPSSMGCPVLPGGLPLDPVANPV